MINGRLIKEAREKLNLSQGELARGITNQASISLLEKNNRAPSVKVLSQISDRLNVDLNDLLGNPNKIKFQDQLSKAEQAAQQYNYQAALDILDGIDISAIHNDRDRARYGFLRTVSKMWISQDFKSAIFAFSLLLENTPKQDDIYYFLLLNGIGVAYYQNDNHQEAAVYFHRIVEQIGHFNVDHAHFYWALFLLSNLAKFYSRESDLPLSNQLAEQGIRIAKSHSTTLFVEDFYYVYAFNLSENGADTAKAISYYRLAESFSVFNQDSIVMNKAREKITRLEKKI
ncbi:helix-turn-helix domain-containing protein [Oenococcus kitaharae]|uniref:helix-turn-helix domain-containing protein n=3 Tax=Lactobacillaceae TaxID=33958 RepID=UPI0021E8E895|nr:helix-turn-helix transcriptional regulator [Oenococcus kitaharae]MCV3296897.1 helix-turn-helix domain-containing protein [Oenococcus kitaharae]